MSKRVDLFTAKREMSANVAEFTKCVILRKKIQMEYKAQIESVQNALNNLDNLKGSIHEDKIPEMRTTYEESLSALEKARDEQIEAEAKFEKTDGDKRFVKALKNCHVYAYSTIASAIREWFKDYGLDVAESTLESEIMDAIGGKVNFNELVDSCGTNGITVDNNRALQMLYWVLFRHMVIVGTIKEAQIPSIISDKYGRRALVAKKEAKKAEKNNK